MAVLGNGERRSMWGKRRSKPPVDCAETLKRVALPVLAVAARSSEGLFATPNGCLACCERTAQVDPKGTLGTGSAGLAVGGAYLAVAAGIDHLVAELGVARQDAPVDRAGGGDDLAVAAQ